MARIVPVGHRVKAAREAAGMSQEQLADAVGVTRNTVYNLESESTKPKADTLWRIAQATGKSLDWFFQDPSRPLNLLPALMAAAVEGAANMPEPIGQVPEANEPDRLDRIEFLLERLDGRMERIEHALVDIAAGLREESEEGGSAYGAA